MKIIGIMGVILGGIVYIAGGIVCLCLFIGGLWNLLTFDFADCFVMIGASVVGGWVVSMLGGLLMAVGAAMGE